MSLFDRTSIVLKYAVLSGAALYITVYMVLAILRIPYPYELEWMEGSSVDHVQRVLDGKPLYVAPSVDFVPMIYPPLYYYVAAGVAKFTGIGFTPLRLVSFFSSLGCLFLIFYWVRRESFSWQAALIAAGLFAASYRISGAWLDIARVDSLFLLFLLVAAYLIRFYDTAASYVIAGVLLALSFLTKQVALVAATPLIVYVLLREHLDGPTSFLRQDRLRSAPTNAILLGGTFVVIAAGTTLILNSVSDGWYNFYVFQLASSHPLVKSVLIKFWSRDILLPMSISCLLALFYLFIRVIQNRKDPVLFYALFALGMLATSWLPRVKEGGYDSNMIPAYAAIAILLGIAIPVVLEFHREKLATTKELSLAHNFLYVALAMQFAVLIYNPMKQIPTPSDREAGDGFIRKIAAINGDVFLPFHGYLSTLAGKKSHAHIEAIWDVFVGNNERIKAMLQEDMERALREKRFAALVLDEENLDGIAAKNGYILQGKLFDREDVFHPVSGWWPKPECVFVPSGKVEG